ncbi:MAG: vWA domain-containing protein [Deltaproteobacteria bacterium]
MHDEQLPGLLDFAQQDHTAAQVRTQSTPHTRLDVSLVVDTTGSMGDELAYLQSELLAISSSIEANYPGAEQRWSLVAYRDRGDVYTTLPFDFGTDPEVFRQHLADQSAGGGGDIPEAPEAALAAMNQLSWRTDDATARLAFWVADAPHHAEQATAMKAAFLAAQSAGVHIYPVASSGVDELTELSMRSAAQLTGGRYLFLTDDSGVGNSHKEPSIPCYFVTKLNAAILRMVDIEMSGVYREPTAAELIRAGGNPQDGACTLASGQTVFVF